MSAIRTLKWTVRAVEDLARIRAFIAADHPSAARRAAACIKEAAAMLLDQPAMGRPVDDLLEFHDWFIPFGKHGYMLRCRLDERVIVVVRVWHDREERNAGDP